MDQLLDFSGKVALITGGSRGLGLEMALALAERGADIIVASRKAEACEEVAKRIEGMGRRALPYGCHVGHWEELGGLVDAAYAEFGKIDILINNAGMSPLYDKLTDVNEELFDKVVGLNLKGPFRLMSLIGERMASDGGGSIINISSTASLNPSPDSEPYGAAKAGLNALTRSFAFAYGPDVRVNCIVAGPFLTDISKAWDMEAFNERAEVNIAAARGGQPNEIVGAALYLASSTSGFTTGTTIRVDVEPADKKTPQPTSPEDPANASLHDVLDLLAAQVEKLKESLEFYRLTEIDDKDSIIRWHVAQIDQRQDRMDELKLMILADQDDSVH